MRLSDKLNVIPPYLFNEIDILRSSVKNPVDFGIGDPDMPTPNFIIDEMEKQLVKSANHRYPSYIGMPELRKAIKTYFKERFNTELDENSEMIVLIGSKEGIAHSLQSIIDPGDEILIPSICYPVYRTQALMNGAAIKEFPIKFENKFVPKLSDIEKKISKKTKLLFLNYPNNPTGASVDLKFYNEISQLCKERNIIVLNDAVYSEVYFSKNKPPSMMQAKYGKTMGLEFHSFSKTFNMTGWRIGFAVGNRELINALKQIKMNTDSGVFNPIQLSVIKALKNRKNHIKKNNDLIAKRASALGSVLKGLGFQFHMPDSTFYIFAKTIKQLNSFDMTKYLIKNAGIITTPGIGFGKEGDNYIRFSLTLRDSELERGIKKLKALRV